MKATETKRNIKTIATITIFVLVALVVPKSAWCVPTYYEMYVEKECAAAEETELFLPGIAHLTVPAGALDVDTDIGMQVSFWWNADSPDVVLEFGPHGTFFNTPVEVRLSLLMMHFYHGDEIAIQYYNDETGMWEWVETIEVNYWTRNYTVQLDHFSIYAFVKIRSGN